jgi:hypothetical protein
MIGLNPIFINHLSTRSQYYRRSKDRVKLPPKKATSEYLLVAFILQCQVGAIHELPLLDISINSATPEISLPFDRSKFSRNVDDLN